MARPPLSACHWRSVRNSPRSFSTFPLKLMRARSTFGTSITSGFFILSSYSLALVTTSLRYPIKAWNFRAMVTTFSCSSYARTFFAKVVAVKASTSFSLASRPATYVFNSAFSLSRQSIRAQRSSISQALGSTLMWSTTCRGSTPNSKLISSSACSMPRYWLLACWRLLATAVRGLYTHSGSSSCSGCTASDQTSGCGGGRCSG